MHAKKATKSETEAELETRARQALLKALPWLDPKSIEQQVTFTLRFGHATITVDGKEKSKVFGRVDILISYQGVPLLVLELKRANLGITQEDVEQGLSYARVMHPRPPLVLVTDGKKRRLIETHTGADWSPIKKDAAALKALLENVALVAADDMKQAVGRLLADQPARWGSAARAVTNGFLQERTGDWSMDDLPFVEKFILPRMAVAGTVDALKSGQRLILIEGDAVVGKSSALRELVQSLETDPDFDVMILDADSGLDLFTALADIWSAHFAWPLTAAEARHWVQQLSRTPGPALVLAIDDFDGRRSGFRRDLEALTSDLFGDRIRVVLALDPTAAERLSVASNGRTASALKRRGARRLQLGRLSDEEFEQAERHLSTHGVSVMPGAQHTPSLRLPWVLRAMWAAALAKRPGPNMSLVLPSVLGLRLLAQIGGTTHQVGSLRRYAELASLLFDDTLDADRSPELRLEALDSYLIRRDTLRAALDDDEISELAEAGLIRETRSAGGEAVFSIQHPMVLAAALVDEAANRIAEASDDEEVTETLVRFASGVPLGAVIVASAIATRGEHDQRLPGGILTSLMARPPRKERLPDGTAFILNFEGQALDVRVVGEQLEVTLDGETHVIDIEDEPLGETVVDLEPWTILSHLAARRMGVTKPGPKGEGRLDMELMLMIGQYPGILLEVGDRPAPLGLKMHDLPGGGEGLCRSEGIAEPITFALLELFRREPELAGAFVQAAIETGSAALLMRVDTALSLLVHECGMDTGLGDPLKNEVRPALVKLLG